MSALHTDQPVLRRGYVDTPGGQVHYHERPGEGPAIAFLHQTPSNGAMWERVLSAYPEGRRLIALDTPGFGMSQAPAQVPENGISYYARNLLAALDGLGVDRFDVVGLHTGAVIGLEVANQAGERVGGLVLIGLVVVSPEEGRERLGAVSRWAPDSDGSYLADRLLPAMRKRVTTGDAGHFHYEIIAVMQAGPDWWWGYDGVFTYDAAAVLPDVKAPILLAVGEDDEPAMVPWNELAARLAPNAEYRILPNLTNEMTFEAPERVADVINAFLGAGS